MSALTSPSNKENYNTIWDEIKADAVRKAFDISVISKEEQNKFLDLELPDYSKL